MNRSLVITVMLALFVAGFAGITQAQDIPPSDSIVGEWVLASNDLVVVAITSNGAVAGSYAARDMADGVVDRHPVSGALVDRELRLSVVGTGHPGYTLRWVFPDRLEGALVGIPGEERIFLRRLPFAGQNPG